jgi:hypothetical protein
MMPVQAGFKQDTSRVEASYQRERSSQSLSLSSLIDYCLLAPSYLPLCGRIVGDTWVHSYVVLQGRLRALGISICNTIGYRMGHLER